MIVCCRSEHTLTQVPPRLVRARSAQALNSELLDSPLRPASTSSQDSRAEGEDESDGVVLDLGTPSEANGRGSMSRKQSLSRILSRSSSGRGKHRVKTKSSSISGPILDTLLDVAPPASFASPDPSSDLPETIDRTILAPIPSSSPLVVHLSTLNESAIDPISSSSTDSTSVESNPLPPKALLALPSSNPGSFMAQSASQHQTDPAAVTIDEPKGKRAEYINQDTVKRVREPRKKKKVTIEDFELIRVLGRGCAGKVRLVSSPSDHLGLALDHS